MIDLKALEIELHQARLARIDAQAAGSRGRGTDLAGAAFRARPQRMLFMIDCGEPESFGAAN